MRKTDKKIDNQLRAVLTDVCEHMLTHIEGFEWLTHFANYSNFPSSLKVVLIFDTNDHLDSFLAKPAKDQVLKRIDDSLLEIGLKLRNINSHVSYDTEENCDKHSDGKWNERFKWSYANKQRIRVSTINVQKRSTEGNGLT